MIRAMIRWSGDLTLSCASTARTVRNTDDLAVFRLVQPDLVAVMSIDHSDLELVVRHVAEERRIVARQRELIARLRAAGASTSGAEETLKAFEANLAIFEERERDLRQKG